MNRRPTIEESAAALIAFVYPCQWIYSDGTPYCPHPQDMEQGPADYLPYCAEHRMLAMAMMLDSDDGGR